MSTHKDFYCAINDIHNHFKKIEAIVSSLPNDAQEGLLNFQNGNNNLIDLIKLGALHSDELLDKLGHGQVAFVNDPSNYSLVLKEIDLPFKADEFPSLAGGRAHNEVIYVPEDSNSIHGSFTANDFVRVIETALGNDKSNYDPEQIEFMAEKLWKECEWQHPETVIDVEGIESFIESLPRDTFSPV